MRGGTDDEALNVLIDLITSNLNNNVTFDTSKLNRPEIIQAFHNIIAILKKNGIEVSALERLIVQITKNEDLKLVEIFEVVKMLYKNRSQLAEKLTDLSTVLEAVLNIIIENVPLFYRAPALAAAKAFIFALKRFRSNNNNNNNNNPMNMNMNTTDTSQSPQPPPKLPQTYSSPVVV
jgi:hypothetical protein